MSNGKLIIRTRRNSMGQRYVTTCPGSQPDGKGGFKGRTKVQFKQDCDINRIVARFKKTGELPVAGRMQKPLYGDFTSVGTFQESLNVVATAQAQFQLLPAKVRQRFGNDPAQFLAFCGDPKNMNEMIELGLAEKRKPDAVPKQRVKTAGGGKKAPAGEAGGKKPKKGADQ